MDHVQHFTQAPDAVGHVTSVVLRQNLRHLLGGALDQRGALGLTVDSVDAVAARECSQDRERNNQGVLRELGGNAEALHVLENAHHLKIETLDGDEAAELLPVAEEPGCEGPRKHTNLPPAVQVE